MDKGKILIAGGTGLIGSAVRKEAEALGYEVTVLSRLPGPGRIVWNPAARSIQTGETLVFNAVINLAGSSIAAGRWTNARQRDIIQSRLDSAGTLEEYIKNGLLKTGVYIGSSGVGIYGNRGDEVVNEDSPIVQTNNWLVNITGQWEAAHQRIRDLGIRTVITRIGLVLSKEGGALKEVLMPAKFGLLTYFGNGRQYWPWIHIRDIAVLLLHAVEDEMFNGIYVAATPHPLTNREFIKEINKQFTWKRIVMPVPKWVLSIMLGRMHQVLFDSCNAQPTRLMLAKFEFRHPHLESAMKEILGKQG